MRGKKMDRNKVRVTIKEIVSDGDRWFADWSSDTTVRTETSEQEIKGKAERFWSNVKEAIPYAKATVGPKWDEE
jgi:hypothetical protein